MHTPDVVSALKMTRAGNSEAFIATYEEEVMRDHHGWTIRIGNVDQKKYIDTVKTHDVVFGVGPAGVGKTFLAVVVAVAALKKGEVQKIILTRPAAEAGEGLDFLPGNLKERVDPYLRPVYDALYQTFGMDYTNRLMERSVTEIAPLAYMRGRTSDGAFIILDEAQNITVAQVKMFLARLEFSSKMVINGDTNQVDSSCGVTSGLVNAEHMLKDIEKVAFVDFEANDVMCHPVVTRTIQTYEKGQQKHS